MLLLSVFLSLSSIKFCSWLISYLIYIILFRALAHFLNPWHLGQSVIGTSVAAILIFPMIISHYLVKLRSYFLQVLCKWKEVLLLQLLIVILILWMAVLLHEGGSCYSIILCLWHLFVHTNTYITNAFLIRCTQAHAILGWHFPTRPEGVRCLNEIRFDCFGHWTSLTYNLSASGSVLKWCY